MTHGDDEEGDFLRDAAPFSEAELEFIGAIDLSPAKGRGLPGQSAKTTPGVAVSRLIVEFRPGSSEEERHALVFHAVAQYASLLFASTECKTIEMQRALQAARDRAEQLLEQLKISTASASGAMIDRLKVLWTNKDFLKSLQRNRGFLWNTVKPIADDPSQRIVTKSINNVINDSVLSRLPFETPTFRQRVGLQTQTSETPGDFKPFSGQLWYDAFKNVFFSSADMASKTNERLIFYMIMIGVYTFEHNYRQAVRMTDLGYWESVPSDPSQITKAPPVTLPGAQTKPVVPLQKPKTTTQAVPAAKKPSSSAASSSSASSSGSSSKPLSSRLPSPPIVGPYPAPGYSSSQGSGGAVYPSQQGSGGGAVYPSSSQGSGGYRGGRGSAGPASVYSDMPPPESQYGDAPPAAAEPSQATVYSPISRPPPSTTSTKKAFGRFLSDM